MVLRAACSIEASTFSNGVRNSERDGRTSDVAATEASVDRVGSRTVNEGRGNARFSLFRWFKRSGNRDSSAEKRRKTIERYAEGGENGRRRSVSSSVESVDTFYSTTTVRSFAFHTGTLGKCDGFSLDVLEQAGEVGPFAAGASKVVAVGNKENELASTLPANVHRRDITARYSLQPSTAFNSCGNLSPLPDRTLLESLEGLDERKARYTVNSTRRRVHVKGKRRAPNPPASSIKGTEVDARETARNGSRRKRRAPKPPEKIVDERDSRAKKWEDRVTDGGMDAKETRPDTEDVQTLSNDTLVLQGGVLLSKREVKRETKSTRDTSGGSSDTAILRENQSAAATVATLSAAMPRPWYKRSVFEHSRDSGASRRGDVLRAPTSSTIEIKEECGAANATTTITATTTAITTAATSTGYSVDASLSRLSFFHRGGSQAEDRKREAKRRSGLSILTNISELDKEAAAIVQEEQARARASMLFNSSRFVDAFERRSDANEELVQDIVTSAMESSSPRRGTRALISKFNAISNITKVTVNSNFFARNARDQQPGKFERDAARNAKVFEHGNDRHWNKDHPRFNVQSASGQAGRVEKDISRYFPPQQKAGKSSRVEDAEMGGKISGTKSGPSKEQNDKLASETSNRISFLQSQLAANRTSDQILRKDSCATTEEKIRSKQEEKREKETRTSNEDLRRYLFPRNSAETRERVASRSVFEEPRKLTHEQQRVDGVQKEFSDIFDEIDKQLRTKEFKFIDRRSLLESATPTNQRNKVGEEEAGISSKVTKVLDILVEAEKDAKTKSGAPPEKSIILEDTSRPTEPNVKTKSGNSGRSPLLNTIEDPITTDLKEMLKEMKHSLPKRSKPGKIVTRNTDVTERPVVTEKETVNVSDPGKTRYFVSAVTKVENITVPNDYELDKQKVSCSVQTSGNIRRLNQPSVEQPSTSGWKQENVLYKTSGKSLGNSGLKNTFQLIRPRDFAEIEATKTTRAALNENTYANVIEQSIYANAHVPPPSPKPRSNSSRPANVTKIDNTASKASPTIQRKFPTQEDTFEGSGEEGNFN